MTKIDSRLRQQCSKLCNMVVGVLSLAPCYSEKIRTAGTSPGVPGDILGSYEELRWMEPHMSSPSPCIELSIKKGEDKGRKRERSFTSIQMLHTHTHTRPEPGQPWKARGRKKRTHDGQTAKNSAGGGGEQTDLRNQPTRRNGPDKNSAHT